MDANVSCSHPSPYPTARQRESANRSFWQAGDLARAQAHPPPNDEILGQNRRRQPRGLLTPQNDNQPPKPEKPSRLYGWTS